MPAFIFISSTYMHYWLKMEPVPVRMPVDCWLHGGCFSKSYGVRLSLTINCKHANAILEDTTYASSKYTIVLNTRQLK